MITTIIEGMTSVQFINAINDNTEGVLIGSYTPVNAAMTSLIFQNTFNANMSKSDVMVGIDGDIFINLLNAAYSPFYLPLLEPTAPTLTWIDDFLRISFTASGAYQHEIWQSFQGAAYSLLVTLNPGVTTYDITAYQNADYSFRIRAKSGAYYSTWAAAISMRTPLVFFTDQSSSFTQVLFHQIRMDDASTLHVDWGDGDEDDYTPVGNVYDELFHDYTIPGTYYIKLTTNVDLIEILQFYEQPIDGTDITKWIWTIQFCHLWTNGLIGNISAWTFKNTTLGCHFANNNLYGDLTHFPFTGFPNYWDCHLSNNHFTGDISGWVLPPKLAHLYIGTNDFTGDISGWVLPVDVDYITVYFYLDSLNITGDISAFVLHSKLLGFSCDYCHLSGDLSGWVIPASTQAIELSMGYGNSFTKLPRGNFRWVHLYQFRGNSCNTVEIDAILAYIDAYFAGGVVPLTDCDYDLSGAGMGAPTAAGMVSRASILAKYIAAGKVATILVN